MPHTHERAAAERVRLLVLELHELGHEGGDADDVGGELLLSGDGRGGEGGDGHLLDGPLGRPLEHGRQFPDDRAEERADPLGLARRPQHISRTQQLVARTAMLASSSNTKTIGRI